MSLMMQQQVRRGRGRPEIGPKVQTHVAKEIHELVREEAKRRGCKAAVVWREMIEQAHATRAARGWGAR